MAFFFKLPTLAELTKEQQLALNETRPIRICGGAGTGKTVVSLWRHVQNFEASNEKFKKSSMLVTYTNTLHSYLLQTVKTLSDEAWKSVFSDAGLRSHKDYNNQWKVDEIIVDEAQDLQYNWLNGYKNHANSISYGADFNQQLYKDRITEEQMKDLFPNNQEYSLQQNFRNTYCILNFVKSVLPDFAISQAALDELKSSERIGEKPELIIVKDEEQEIAKIIEIIKIFQSDTHNIAVLLPFGNSGQENVDNYYNLLQQKNINCSKYHTYMNRNNVNIENVHVTTYKSAKGLEFDTVIIPYFNKFQDFIQRSRSTKVDYEDYYVALTRTKRNLYLISNSELNFIYNDTIKKIQL